MAPDGTGVVRLTNDTGEDFDPAWSPDSAKIVWTSNRAGNYDLYTMDANGTNVSPVTSTPALDEFPDWRRTCARSGVSSVNCSSPAANAIAGGDGDDVVFAGRGTDHVYGGLGNDVLVGGAGDDLLLGQNGNDRLSGGPAAGDDVLQGATGADFLAALDGERGDHLNGGTGVDGCLSDAGDTRLSC